MERAEAEAILDRDRETAVGLRDSFIAPGFQSGVMPSNFGEALSEEEIEELVAFVAHSNSSE